MAGPAAVVTASIDPDSGVLSTHDSRNEWSGRIRSARLLVSSRKLLKTLTDNPALPAFVRTLEAPVLKRLIEHVGLHDAGDLIALTTTEQMRDILEESLWETLIPCQAERLRPERFLAWLDVMLEAGTAFAAKALRLLRRPGHVRAINRTFGGVLVAMGALLATFKRAA